jgi:uncharacterized membrane protein SirB2
MIELWLRSGTVGIVLVPFLLLYAIAALIVWVTHKSPARPYFASCVGIPGPFFASVAVLFGLFAAFLANDVQRRDAEAQAAVLREADGVRTILRISEALGQDADPVKAAAVGYAQSVLDEELPAMRQRGAIADDLAALRVLGNAMLAPPFTASVPQAAQTAMLGGLVAVRQARLERLTLAGDASAPINWLATIMLGVFTQIAIAIVQLDKIRPQALALFVFTTAFATTIALIGLGERPFSGRAIDDTPLRAAITSAERS